MNLDAAIHKAISPFLTKRQQGEVMGAIRALLAEQPAKGEKWRCACGDLNYPNETCAMCNQSAPQPSDPADAVLALPDLWESRAETLSSRNEYCSGQSDALYRCAISLREAIATPPTAQRHDEGKWKHATARQLIRMADNITEYSAEQMAEKMRQAAYCITTLFSVSNALRDAIKKQEPAHGAGAAVEAVAEADMHALFSLRDCLEDLKQKRWKARDWDVSDQYVNANIGHAAKTAEWSLPALNRVLGVLLDNAYYQSRPQQHSEQVDGITPAWVIGYLPVPADPETVNAIQNAFAEYAALSTQPLLSDQPGGVSDGAAKAYRLLDRFEKIMARWRGTEACNDLMAKEYEAALHSEQAKDR